MMKNFILGAALLAAPAVFADTIAPRLLQGCEYVPHMKSILCLGGTTSSVDVWHNFKPSNDIMLLNVSSPISPSAATSSITLMAQPSTYVVEPRAEFAHVLVNETRLIVMSGAGSGTNYQQSSLKNITTWYDTQTNTWGTYDHSTIPITYVSFDNKVTSFNVTPLFNQLQGTTACTLAHNGSSTWTYAPQLAGGLRLDNPKLIDDSITSVYPIFAANTSDWSQIMAGGLDKPASKPRTFRQQSVRSENDRVWFFGGMQYNTTLGQGYTGTDDSQDAVSFSSYWFLDDANGYFNQTFSVNSNAQFPAGRYWHSLTLLPGKGQVLMYGGYFAGKPSTDIAYLFDTNTLAWTVPNISNLKPRFGHSAIAVGQDTVYFLFGVDGNLNLLNSVDILNTTSWTFLDADVTNSLQNSNGGGGSTGSTGITTGAIAGIVVGVVVGLGAIIGAAFVCIRKRRNREIPEAPAMFHEMGRQSEFPAQPQPPAFPTQPQPPAFPAQTHQSSFPDNSTVSSTVTPNSVQMGSIKPTDNSTFVSSPSTQYFAPVKPTEYHHEPDHTTLIKPYADH